QVPGEALSRFRFSMLGRVSDLLDQNQPTPGDGAEPGALREVTALLATSLEELKVAEEELRGQNATLLEQRAASETRVRYYRELFMQSPVPSFITDLFGTIEEVNLAAGRLLRRDVDLIVRKPFAAIVANQS